MPVSTRAPRLFSLITKNWRGKPLVSHEVIVNLIAATTTRTGLRIQSQLDTGKYTKGIKVGKQEFAAIHLRPDHYTIADFRQTHLQSLAGLFTQAVGPSRTD